MSNMPSSFGMCQYSREDIEVLREEFRAEQEREERCRVLAYLDEELAFGTPEALKCLEDIARCANALDKAMASLDALIPPPEGCVSGLTADNRHGWFIRANLDVPVLRSVSRVKG